MPDDYENDFSEPEGEYDDYPDTSSWEDLGNELEQEDDLYEGSDEHEPVSFVGDDGNEYVEVSD